MTSPKENPLKDQKGQTFLEFIFLLLILMTTSFTLLRGFNAHIGNRWETMLKIIAIPNGDKVSLP
jgi:hypothetical protein